VPSDQPRGEATLPSVYSISFAPSPVVVPCIHQEGFQVRCGISEESMFNQGRPEMLMCQCEKTVSYSFAHYSCKKNNISQVQLMLRVPPLHVHSSPRFRQCIVHALIKDMSQCFTPRSGPHLTWRHHDGNIAHTLNMAFAQSALATKYCAIINTRYLELHKAKKLSSQSRVKA